MRKYLVIILITCVQRTGWSQIDPSDTKQLMSEYVKSQPDTNRIKLLLRIAECFFYKIRVEDRMDSVKLYLNKAQELNNKFRIATYQNTINFINAKRHIILNPYDDPKVVFMPVIDECKKTGDKRTEMLALAKLGYMMSEEGPSLPYKQACYDQALSLAQQLNDYESEFEIERYITSMSMYTTKTPANAERDKTQLLRKVQKAGVSNEMFLYLELSEIYTKMGDYDKALFYAFKELNLMGVTRDSSSASHTFRRISMIYRLDGKHKEEVDWAKKATDLFSVTMIPGLFNELDHIMVLFARQGRHSDALKLIERQIAKKKPSSPYDQRKIHFASATMYQFLEKYDLAEKNFLEAFRLANEQKSQVTKDDMGFICSGIGKFYFKRGEYNKSIQYLEESLRNYQEINLVPHMMNTLQVLIKADSAVGNFEKAYQYLRISTVMADSVLTDDRNRQIEKLTVSYRTDQKSDSIRILQQTQQLVQLKLQQTKATRNWIIGGAGMLFIIAGLLFRQGQLRKKNNKLINGKNAQLQHLVNEKDWLVREIHHRVKNNLQIVMSLLNSQSAYIQNDAALNAINDSQHRVHAMSLIHQKLYGSENVSSIDMHVYVHELVSYLRDTFDTRQRIRFELNIEPLQMDVSQAVPLGLILNEAITNSIKYAFPGDRNGTILISLSHNLANHYVLSIIDNGVGLTADSKKTGSLGMSLMKGLSEDLDGNFSIANSNGTTVKVSFVYDPSIKTHDAMAANFISNN